MRTITAAEHAVVVEAAFAADGDRHGMTWTRAARMVDAALAALGTTVSDPVTSPTPEPTPDAFDIAWARARAWREHVASKRSSRQARKSSFEAGWDAALSSPLALAAHDAQVRATADAVIRAVLDALGVGHDHDPVLAARDAASVRDRFNEWLDEHDAQVAEKAWDKAVAMCCQMLGARNVNWPNPHRARAAEAGEPKRCPDCGRSDSGCDREVSPDA